MSSTGKDYFRPRGDITTVLDLTDRDSQDLTFFPVDTEGSWFHRENGRTVYPTTVSIQEFVQRGPAGWGQKCTFELGSLSAGDMLQSVMLQIKLDHWLPPTAMTQLLRGEITTSNAHMSDYWTYANSLGTSIIEYADFIVKDQTIERITGDFIRVFYDLFATAGQMATLSADAIGSVPVSALTTLNGTVYQTAFHPRRPYPTEDGVLFCQLPFFFARTPLKQVFPLLSCNEGDVRIDIKLRPFAECVRQTRGWRTCMDATPLGQSTSYIQTAHPTVTVPVTYTNVEPAFRDFRIVATTCYTMGSVRERFLRQPVEQLIKPVQIFHFEEPLKYLVSKGNANTDVVEIQFPLDLNHPVAELIWVFRRKACRVNNEWTNFTPSTAMETRIGRFPSPWLQHATLRMNGVTVVSDDGEWFRQHIAEKHTGGITSYFSHIYGYSFARFPEDHQPSGTANTSRTHAISLALKVRTPMEQVLPQGTEFSSDAIGGWEVLVFAIQYNWLRFENGICQKVFMD